MSARWSLSKTMCSMQGGASVDWVRRIRNEPEKPRSGPKREVFSPSSGTNLDLEGCPKIQGGFSYGQLQVFPSASRDMYSACHILEGPESRRHIDPDDRRCHYKGRRNRRSRAKPSDKTAVSHTR